jgi:hypothetical protein
MADIDNENGEVLRVLQEDSVDNMRGVTQRTIEENTINNLRGVTKRVYVVATAGFIVSGLRLAEVIIKGK